MKALGALVFLAIALVGCGGSDRKDLIDVVVASCRGKVSTEARITSYGNELAVRCDDAKLTVPAVGLPQ